VIVLKASAADYGKAKEIQDTASSGTGVQTVERALALLTILSSGRTEAEFGVTELSKMLGVGKSSVHRLLTSLQKYDFVEKNPRTEKYHLGWGVFAMASQVPKVRVLQRAARDVLEELCLASKETVNLAILEHTDVVTIDKVEPNSILKMDIPIGLREPAYATALGKAILSDLDPEAVRRRFQDATLQKLTPQTVTDVDELISLLRRVGKRGYAIDNQEYSVDIRCVGAPIRGSSGRAIAAVSVTGPAQRFSLGQMEEITPLVVETAATISERLGYRGERTG